MTDAYKPRKVLGHLVNLTDDRIVFLGFSDEHPDHVYVATRNDEGEDTYLAFNADAAAALQSLLNGEHDNEPRVAFPHQKPSWTRVLGGRK
jgi:hypothetical protein